MSHHWEVLQVTPKVTGKQAMDWLSSGTETQIKFYFKTMFIHSGKMSLVSLSVQNSNSRPMLEQNFSYVRLRRNPLGYFQDHKTD